MQASEMQQLTTFQLMDSSRRPSTTAEFLVSVSLVKDEDY